MKFVVFVAVLGASAPIVAAGQTRCRDAAATATPPSSQAAATPASSADKTADAYAQFLAAHVFADQGNLDEAINAYKRAMALDPESATIPAELAELLQGENRTADAQAAAEQALKVDPANKQAHRVLGQLYAGLASNAQDTRTGRASQQENITRAIEHFEKALETPVKQTDIDVRALLGRLYVAANRVREGDPDSHRHREGSAVMA
ncbi:MAG: tetratricopeptide repeat protein [Vicinamibacterales bacterium]